MELPGAGGLLLAYEMSALGAAARSSLWLYPVANLLHVLGAALLVGAIATFDLAVLRRSKAVAAIGPIAVPLAASGLALQLGTGVILLSAEASTMVVNPAFQLKGLALAIGIANLAWFHWRFDGAIAEGLVPDRARRHAAVSLVAWVTVLLAGRGTAYL